jgi:hypothetical protein
MPEWTAYAYTLGQSCPAISWLDHVVEGHTHPGEARLIDPQTWVVGASDGQAAAWKPLALLVMTAPTRNSPSIRANSMWSAALHPTTSVHAAQTVSVLALAMPEAS